MVGAMSSGFDCRDGFGLMGCAARILTAPEWPQVESPVVDMPGFAVVPAVWIGVLHDDSCGSEDGVDSVPAEPMVVWLVALVVGVVPREERHALPEVGSDSVFDSGPVLHGSSHALVDDLEEDEGQGVAGHGVGLLGADVEEVLHGHAAILGGEEFQVGPEPLTDAGPLTPAGIIGPVGTGVMVPEGQRAKAED